MIKCDFLFVQGMHLFYTLLDVILLFFFNRPYIQLLTIGFFLFFFFCDFMSNARNP